MKNLQKERAAAFFLAGLATIVLIGSMIIIQETSGGFKGFLNRLTGHHWVTKSVLAIILFPVLSILFYFMLGSERIRRILKSGDIWFWSLFTVLVTVILILGSFFIYLFHYLRG